jgi:hypothetical protein
VGWRNVRKALALGISVNRGNPPPNFTRTFLAAAYNLGR